MQQIVGRLGVGVAYRANLPVSRGGGDGVAVGIVLIWITAFVIGGGGGVVVVGDGFEESWVGKIFVIRGAREGDFKSWWQVVRLVLRRKKRGKKEEHNNSLCRMSAPSTRRAVTKENTLLLRLTTSIIGPGP